VVPTFGGYSQVSPPKQQELLGGIGTATDAAGSRFTTSYAAVVATAARSGAR
jgi:hypothetical protein